MEVLAALAILALIFSVINRNDDEAQYRMTREDYEDGPDSLYRVVEFVIITLLTFAVMVVVFGGTILITSF